MEAATQKAGSNLLQSYGPEGFKINGELHAGSVLISEQVIASIDVADISTITIEILEPLLAAIPRIEVLIIGTGATLKPIPAALKQQLRARDIRSDAMDTGAACRTYSVLASEDRRAGAVLLALS